jgi:hypothetical protein
MVANIGPPKIDDTVFDNAFGRLAGELDPFCEGAKVGVMANLIAGFSGFIGPDVRIQSGESLAAWFVLVGLSGKGYKGTTARMAMPVIEKAFPDWSKDHVIRGMQGTGLGLVTQLNEHKGRPVFMLEEEMRLFLRAAKGDSRMGTNLTKVWDGQPLVHKTSKTDLRVDNPHMAVIGHVQPRIWATVSGTAEAASGLVNRFLPIWVQRSKRLPKWRRKEPAEVGAFVAKELQAAGMWARDVTDPVIVPDDVADFYEEFHRPMYEALTEGDELLSELVERVGSYVDRLAGLYALGDQRMEISVRDFDSALALVTYSVDTIRHVLTDVVDETPEERLFRRLRERRMEQVEAREAGEDVPPDLRMSDMYDIYGRNKTKEQVRRWLDGLPHIEIYDGKSTGGRPPSYVRLIESYDHMEVSA